MQPPQRQQRRSHHRLRALVLTTVLVGLGLFVLSGRGWFEGQVTASVRFANGGPAAHAGVQFRPLAIRGPYNPGTVRLPMEVLSTDRDGRWREVNTWPYGQYQLTVLADARGTLPLEQCAVTIWPMTTTHVTITIAGGGGSEPPSQLPLGCVTSLRPLRP